jgi:FKBP-type peptidyl-prolyl cis-trans isomerase (trigger factor)
MAKLEYTMTNDILFKMFFVKNPKFLKRLVSMMLKTPKHHQNVAHSNEFREIERLRERTRHNEASALGHAARVARKEMADEILKRMKDANLPPDLIEKLLP